MTNLNTILTVAYRDLLKFMRDRPRIISSFVFPFVMILFLGESLEASMGKAMGYDFKLFVFTGVYAQTLFQSAMLGIISLLDDRDNDFSQEIFVSPVSRYAIIIGKVLGESLVAMAQGIGILAFGVLLAIISGADHLGGAGAQPDSGWVRGVSARWVLWDVHPSQVVQPPHRRPDFPVSHAAPVFSGGRVYSLRESAEVH